MNRELARQSLVKEPAQPVVVSNLRLVDDLPQKSLGSIARSWIEDKAAVICAGLCALTMLTACGEGKNESQLIDMQIDKTPALEQRVEVEAIGRFKDSLAYGDERGIYLIKDNKTGKEYLGVSGIGISELGSHTQSNGKHSYTVEDER